MAGPSGPLKVPPLGQSELDCPGRCYPELCYPGQYCLEPSYPELGCPEMGSMEAVVLEMEHPGRGQWEPGQMR